MHKKEVIRKLISSAKKAMKNSHVPRQKHKVGASVLTKKDIHIGANIQTSISGLGTCAERAAINCMVAHGEIKIEAICIVSQPQIYPCGMCLQYLAEFASNNVDIIMSDASGKYIETTLHELMPHVYRSRGKK
jgi:cytidine deaminase